jgi:hypothetical protein
MFAGSFVPTLQVKMERAAASGLTGADSDLLKKFAAIFDQQMAQYPLCCSLHDTMRQDCEALMIHRDRFDTLFPEPDQAVQDLKAAMEILETSKGFWLEDGDAPEEEEAQDRESWIEMLREAIPKFLTALSTYRHL